MNPTFGPGTLTALASLAVGALAALEGALVARAWGAAPLPGLVAAATMLAGWPLVARGGVARAWPFGWTILLLGALPPWVVPGPGAEAWAIALPVVLGLGGALCLGALRAPLLRAGPAHGAMGLMAALVLAPLGAPAAAAAAALLTVLARRSGASLANFGARRLVIRPVRVVVGAVVLGVAAAGWFAVRPACLPAPAAIDRLWLGAALGLLLPFPVVAAPAAFGLAGLVVSAVLQGEAPADGGLVLALCGVAAGAAARALRAGDLLGVAALAALLAVPAAVERLPAEWQAQGARSLATLPDDLLLRDRLLQLQRGGGAHTAWGWWGASQLWGDGERVTLVELDGNAAGSSGRARAAERLAGTLAGCAAAGRDRVRLVGDDFGRAVQALREQGFAGIDVAMPDAELAARLAEADDGARRAWLSADARLLRMPGPLLRAARGEVDAQVELLRVGWSDGRTDWPSAAALAAAHAHVREGGAQVLLVPGLGVRTRDLAGVVRTFAEVWPAVGVWVPPEGAEALVLVGTAAPIPWARVEGCARAAAAGLRRSGIDGAFELGSLAIADGVAARALEGSAGPGRALARADDVLPVAALLADATAAPVVYADAPVALAARQATRRASLGVLRASAAGDVRTALEAARGMQDQPGAGAAIDPMVEPLLDRARASWRAARAEGKDSRHWAEAQAAIDAALLMNPASAAARCLRGDVAMSRREVEAALEAYRECSERDPESWQAFQGLAAAKQTQGDRAGAEAAFRESARLGPEVWQTALNLGVFLRSVGQFPEAETWLRRAEDGASRAGGAGRSTPHRALAMLYLESGRPELALVEARRAELDEPRADAAWLVGAAAWELGRWEEAEAAYRTALERDPRMVEARTGLGMCLARRNDLEGAARSFRDALAVDPDYRVAREKLALLEPLLGRESEAVRRAAPTPAPR